MLRTRTSRRIAAAAALALMLATAAIGGRGSRSAVPDPQLERASFVAYTAPPAHASRTSAAATDVLTANIDARRLGWNDRETALTPQTVASARFRRLFRVAVDGQVYAQPLVVTGVEVGGAMRDLLLVASEGDSVYAFDANSGRLIWRHTFVGCCSVRPAAARRVAAAGCDTVAPSIGVSATPVVDRRSATVYVVAKTQIARGGEVTFQNTLHALALDTGRDRVPGREITGAVRLPLAAAFRSASAPRWRLAHLLAGGIIRFDPRIQFNRPGLLLSGGRVYIAFASHCDAPDAHGWLFAYEARDLRPVAAFATVADWRGGGGGGVWQSGFGITGDAQGNLYVTTGNGPFDASAGGHDYGDSLLKLSPDLRVRDSFTPFNQAQLAESDADFGGGGMIALPDRAGSERLGVVSSKLRALFLVDRDDLGGFRSGGPDRVIQVVGRDEDGSRWCIGTCGGPAYFADGSGEYVLNAWAWDALRTYRLIRTPHPRLVEIDRSPNVFPGFGGTTPTVSSNGLRAGTAVAWATTRPNPRDAGRVPIELIAYDARHLSRVLFRAPVSLWRRAGGAPFLTPTVANGKVYVGGDGSVSAFGLANGPAPPISESAVARARRPGTRGSLARATSRAAPARHAPTRDEGG